MRRYGGALFFCNRLRPAIPFGRMSRQLTIALVAQKGGVGKTTLACCIAAECQARGANVLLVDADPQGTARTWASIALDYERPVPDVIMMGSTMHRRGQLARVSSGYEVVIIDTPPHHSPTLKSALLCADIALLPCGPYAPDAWALTSTIESVNDVRSERRTLEASIIITRAVAGTTTLRETRPVLAASGVPVLRTQCGHRMAYSECLAAGQGVNQYAPASAAAAELRALMAELGGSRHASKAQTVFAKSTHRRSTAAQSRPALDQRRAG